MDLDTAEDEEDFEIRFSADDIVCVHQTMNTNKYTTVNSVAVASNVPTYTAAAGAVAATCTGGWTAWTTTTAW